MNHYKARQLENGKWHYTSRNNGNIFPVGNCSRFMRCPACKLLENVNRDCVICKGDNIVIDPNPCPGHDTAEEAQQHYKEYLIEGCVFRPKFNEWPKYKCHLEQCNSESKHSVYIFGTTYDLCEQHANRETLHEIISVGESWES